MLESIETKLPSIRALLVEAGGVLGYFFGSVAKGVQRPDSDLDVAVFLGPAVPAESYGEIRVRLTTSLIGLTHMNDVDVVILNDAPPLLAFQVISTGRIILGGGARESDSRRAPSGATSIPVPCASASMPP